ncbi:heparinase II/III-like protein [Fontibacillus phaseoli]|uniref:Heparinase II/III-like protein n=1 Tax=Fontibacillus phaseoli TaxID=1416533 RepID=A0A369BIY6_9BACL|nr:heparinase II/III family protein [Fontibacillus phaseoli]RCX21562.1 heparinase II/III-like protein [Fontibacillus phaseoli]
MEITSNTQHGDKLRALVRRAETLLEMRGDFYTDGAKLALEDTLRQAKLALDGKDGLPFVRNREFLKPRPEEAVLFATRRYTMVPPFLEEGSVFTHYGLEPALSWFEKQDVLCEGTGSLPGKAAFVLEKARELLKQAKLGDGIGDYDTGAGTRLAESMEALFRELEKFSTMSSGESTARRIVDVFNRLREFRHSRRLRTDIEPDSSLYLTAKGLEELKLAVSSIPTIREQFKKIERLTELYSVENLEQAVSGIMHGQADYDELNRRFYLWSSTDKIVNFKVPLGAVKATLSLILPKEENEQDGLGHVWIDDLEILTASGGSLNIRNGGFDEGEGGPRHWNSKALKGEPIFRWEDTYPFSGGGAQNVETANPSSEVAVSGETGVRRSLYICNPGPDDEGAWIYDGEFAVEAGAGCTLTFAAKLDGKLKKGLRVLISFSDDQGRLVGEFEYFFNRKSSVPGGRFLLPMQADAIRFAVTGERKYAWKAKLAMLYIFHDFCQGAEHWLVTNLRPEGSDAYGAVQGGRVISVMAVSYTLIRSADVFGPEEKAEFYELVEYMLRYLLDLRDRTEWSPYEAQKGCSNWQTDMCVGTGFMMMALPDFPNRHTWLNNAGAILRAQLELNVNPDGSWPESIRYHHAALERFAGYAKVLKNVTGEDWFETTPLVRMFGYPPDVQTPGYVYFDGRVGTPPFGDHALGGGEEFGYFAAYLSDIAEIDKDLADRMYHTWTAAGKPAKKMGPEGILLENILPRLNRYDPGEPLKLESTADYPDSGIYIFRKDFGSGRESYFAIMSSRKPVAHGHLDQGSFVLYKNSVPLVMDSGIQGYFDSSTPWHICSYSHACLLFATKRKFIPRDPGSKINLSAGTYSLERGWADVPKTSRVLDVRLGEEIESITIEIANPEGRGRHFRHVAYVRKPDLYIIRDEILEFDGKVLFNLPVAAVASRVNGRRIHSKGAYGVDLETVFLGTVDSITLDQGRSTTFYDRGDQGICLMDYVRAVADAKAGFWTVLYPREWRRNELGVTREPDGSISLITEEHLIRVDLRPLKQPGDGAIQRPFEVSVGSKPIL